MTEPAVSLMAAHYSSGNNLPVSRIVIHTTSPDPKKVPYPVASQAGQARGTAVYFTSPSTRGSAHYVCDISATEHCLRDNMIAWHAPPNPHSIGIEICALPSYTSNQWRSPQVWPAVVRAAAVAKELCERHGIAPIKLSVEQVKRGEKGICGHKDVSDAFHQSDHWDPGPNFPWEEFMALVVDPAKPKEVRPMFDPALILEPIVASLKAPDGGVWLLASSGAIYSFETQDFGGAHGKPYFAGRKAARLEYPNPSEAAAGRKYVIVSTDGSRYAYPE